MGFRSYIRDVCMCVCMYVCMYVCVCVCMYVCIHAMGNFEIFTMTFEIV